MSRRNTLPRMACVSALLFTADLIAEDQLPPLEVAYSADETVTTGGRQKTGKLHAMPGRTRLETSSRGMRQVMLMLRDTGEAYALMPDMGMYMQLPGAMMLPDLRHDAEFSLVEKAGSETVAGVEATRYRVAGKLHGRRDFQGDLWLSGQGIALKTELTYLSVKGGSRTTLKELSNLRIGDIDPGLFDIPEGMMQAPGLGAPGAAPPPP